MGEVKGLPLPGGFEGAESHYPLDRQTRECVGCLWKNQEKNCLGLAFRRAVDTKKIV